MDQPTTAVQRLGRVFYMAGIAFGLLLALAIVTAGFRSGNNLKGIGFGFVAFTIFFLAGRAARYVLAGE
jgi:hypothetical protein